MEESEASGAVDAQLTQRRRQDSDADVDADVGDQLRPLSDLTDSEAWAMVESSPDGMILADEYGIILLLNAQIEDLFGYDRGELLGRTVEMLLPQRHRSTHTAHRIRYRAEPTTRAMGSGLDLVGLRKDGTEFPVEVSLSPARMAVGLRVVATVRDVTDRLAMEAHTHAVLHTIDAAHDAVFMFAYDTFEFQYVNSGAVDQLGYSRAELLTMSPLHIQPEFTAAQFVDLLQPLLSGELDSCVFTTLHRRKNGTDLPVEIKLEFPPAAPGGHRPRMLIAVARDITDRLAAEEAVRVSQATVAQLEDRERLARDLHDLVIQQLFATGMSLQSIHHRIDDKHAAQRVADAANQLDDTISELRSAIFALTTAAPTTLTEQITAIVNRAVRQVGFEPTLVFHGDPEDCPADAAAQLLPTITEALSNIARHARATAADIELTVSATSVELVVTDNGVGLDPRRVGGNGLKNIKTRARKLGGSADVTNNKPGEGATLTWTAATRTTR